MAGATQRAQWTSKLGFILAAAGSAIGLGNIWRFPYVTQENGGGIFVVLYILAIVFIGLPVMLAELSIGRHTQANPVGAFRKIAPKWQAIGILGVITGLGIFSYYAVVAGWTLGYVIKSAGNDLDPSGFGPFIGDAQQQILYCLAFIVLTCTIVGRGVQKGIERMAKVLMPVLLILMLALIARGLTLPTAMEGLSFYLTPDIDRLSPQTFLLAIGQAFFSISVGMGVMITYGGYLSKKDNLLTSAVAVVSFDTLIALLAGFMIFPVIGHSLEKGGATLVFVTMIEQFNQMPGGQYVALGFFLLLLVAALTSTVSLAEVVTAFLTDEWRWSRVKAVCVIGVLTILLGIPSALSLGASPALSDIVAGKGFLDIMDFAFGNVFLGLGALLTCIFLIYRWGIGNAAREIVETAPEFARFVGLWRILVGGIVPLSIVILIVYTVATSF